MIILAIAAEACSLTLMRLSKVNTALSAEGILCTFHNVVRLHFRAGSAETVGGGTAVTCLVSLASMIARGASAHVLKSLRVCYLFVKMTPNIWCNVDEFDHGGIARQHSRAAGTLAGVMLMPYQRFARDMRVRPLARVRNLAKKVASLLEDRWPHPFALSNPDHVGLLCQRWWASTPVIFVLKRFLHVRILSIVAPYTRRFACSLVLEHFPISVACKLLSDGSR